MQQHISKQDRLAEEIDLRKFSKAFGLETIQKKTNDVGKSSTNDNSQNEKPSEGQFSMAINSQFLETQIRSYFHTMVEPLLVLAKQNIEHNSKKNERFNDMHTKYEGVQKQIEDLKREVFQLSKLPKQLIQLETLVSSNSQGVKGSIESMDALIRRLQNKVIDAESIREEMHRALDIRELKVKSLDENVTQLKEKMTADSFEQQKKFNSRFDRLCEQIEQGRSDTTALQSLVHRVKTLTEENEQSHLVVEYKIQMLQQQLEEFQSQGIDALGHRLDQNQDKLLQNSQQINDQTVQFRVLLDKNVQLEQTLIETQNFVAQTIPLLNYMQLSDTLKEFLCLSDQKRLIDYDNKMLVSLTETSVPYISLKSYCEQTAKQCLEMKMGLGPFQQGKSLDIDYLKQRYDLINSHHKLYSHLNEGKKQFHIGCLNGTVLKEVKVIYLEKKKLNQLSRRMRQNYVPQYNQVEDATETVSEQDDEVQSHTQEDANNLTQQMHNRRLSKLSSEAQSKYSKPSRPTSSNSNVKPKDTNKRASTYSDNYTQPIKAQRHRTKTTMVGSESKKKSSEKQPLPVEESKVKAIFPQAKNAIINKVLIESSNMNVNIIKEHTTRLEELQASVKNLEDKFDMNNSDRSLFLQALKETQETKQTLDEQHDTIQKLMSQFKTKQEKQEKQAIEMLINFMSKQTAGFDTFKRTIEIEYLEFFKSRQRIRADWSQHCKEVQVELEGLVSLIEQSADLAVKLSSNDQVICRQIVNLAECLRLQEDGTIKQKEKQKSFDQICSEVKASLEDLFVLNQDESPNRTTDETQQSVLNNAKETLNDQNGQQVKEALFKKYSENVKDKLGVLKQQLARSDRHEDKRKDIILPKVSVITESEQHDNFELRRINQSITSLSNLPKRPITAKRQSLQVARHASLSLERPSTSHAARVDTEIYRLYQTATEKISGSQTVLGPKDPSSAPLSVEIRKKLDRAKGNRSIYVTGIINKKINASQLSTVNQDEEL